MGEAGFDQCSVREGWRRVEDDPAQTRTDPGTDLERRRAYQTVGGLAGSNQQLAT